MSGKHLDFRVDISEQIKNIKKSFGCTVCKCLPIEPMLLLTCMHTFCDKCIKTLFNCPTCNIPFRNTDLIHNSAVDNAIDCIFTLEDILEKDDESIKKDDKNGLKLNQGSVNVSKNVALVKSHEPQPKKFDENVKTTDGIAKKNMKRPADNVKTSNVDKNVQINTVSKLGLKHIKTTSNGQQNSNIENKKSDNSELKENSLDLKVVLKKTVTSENKNNNPKPGQTIQDNSSLNPKYIWMSSTEFQKLNKRNTKGETKLQSACIENKIDLVEKFIKSGCDVNTQDNFKWTPLHEAVKRGHVEICKLLIEAGALVDAPNEEYVTPLHEAASANNEEVFQLLLEYGADPKKKKYDGATIMDESCHFKNIDAILKSVGVKNTVQPLIVEISNFEVFFSKCMKGIQLNFKGSDFSMKVVVSVSNKTTHYIEMKDVDNIDVSLELFQIILNGGWVVSQKWYKDCIAQYKVVDPALYEIKSCSLFPNSNAILRSRLNRQMMRPKLFDGCKFFVHGTTMKYGNLTIKKNFIIDLIKMGDGHIYKRCPNPKFITHAKYPYHAQTTKKLKSCCDYIIYLTEKPLEPEYRFPEIHTLKASWLLDCILRFEIFDPVS